MALEITSFTSVTEASGKLATAATNYSAELVQLKTIVDGISWQGIDADAYKDKVKAAITQLEQIAKSLNSQSGYLNSVVDIIKNAQANIASKLMG